MCTLIRYIKGSVQYSVEISLIDVQLMKVGYLNHRKFCFNNHKNENDYSNINSI